MAARILCVDDEHDIARLLDTILTLSGYRTLVASTAAEGLSQARLRPDLIILDINLPDLDGLEACRRLRRLDGRVPVIVLTASTRARYGEALAVGASAFLEKPFDVDELLRLVERLLISRNERRSGGDRRTPGDGPRQPDRRSGERRAFVLHAAAAGHPRRRTSAHGALRPLARRLPGPRAARES